MSILRIGIVGSPNSGKTSLIEYLRNYLKDTYQVFIADEAPTRLLKAGLNPPSNISNFGFQLEVLNEYVSIYNQINKHSILYKEDRNVVILYDTTPLLGRAYLEENNQVMLENWQQHYDQYKRVFEEHKPDKVFITELLQGEYSIKGNSVRRPFNVDDVLSIEERISKIYEDAILLSNGESLEERAQHIINYIDAHFNPNITSYTLHNVSFHSFKIQQTCPYCKWSDSINYDRYYRFCPMCGRMLPNPFLTSKRYDDGFQDPLGEEARRKMFYVDPEKLPNYISYL